MLHFNWGVQGAGQPFITPITGLIRRGSARPLIDIRQTLAFHINDQLDFPNEESHWYLAGGLEQVSAADEWDGITWWPGVPVSSVRDLSQFAISQT